MKPNQTLLDNGPGDPKPAHSYMERRRLSMHMHGLHEKMKIGPSALQINYDHVLICTCLQMCSVIAFTLLMF